VAEVHAPVFRLLDESADLALDLRRRVRNPLIGATYADAKGVGVYIPKIAQDCIGQRAEVVRRASGVGEVRDTKNVPQAIAGRVPLLPAAVCVGLRRQFDLEPVYEPGQSMSVPRQALERLYVEGSVADVPATSLVKIRVIQSGWRIGPRQVVKPHVVTQ